jgi:3-(3-hydroxy-phenyl)propionate hydroxylase
VLLDGQPAWLLRHIGDGFTMLVFGPPDAAMATALPTGIVALFVTAEETPGAVWDHAGLAAARFAAPRGGAVLLRPDQHVAARFVTPDPAALRAALDRALGHGMAHERASRMARQWHALPLPSPLALPLPLLLLMLLLLQI